LDEDAAVLAFRPDAGGFTADEAGVAAPGAWRLRRSTLEAVRRAAGGEGGGESDRGGGAAPDPRDPDDPPAAHGPHDPHGPHNSHVPTRRHDPTSRANRLLATFARHVVGREIPTIEWAFGD
jgi:hypothetical protein